MFTEATERLLRRGLIAAALAGLALGLAASLAGRSTAAQWLWAAGTLPVVMARSLAWPRVMRDAIRTSFPEANASASALPVPWR